MIHVNDFTHFVLDSMGVPVGLTGRALVWFIVHFIPPVLVNAVILATTQAVHAQGRGAEWTTREVSLQAVWKYAAIVLPAAFICAAVDSLDRSDLRAATLCLGAMFVSYVVSARNLARVMNYTPHALTTGELRDHAFALASKAGVNLKQIYVLPAGKGKLANAFAHTGNNILLTDYLLSRLSKREVDAVLAHELAHLQRKHQWTGTVFVMLAMMAGGVLFGVLEFAPPWMPTWPLLVVMASLLARFLSRRSERAADAGSVQLTGDAEALITALLKLHRLNLLPIHWGRLNEGLLTHPSAVRRARALARLGGIGEERLKEILSTNAEEQEHYAIPPPMTAEGKVFSTRFKTARSFRFGWTMTMALPLVLALCAGLVTLNHWQGIALWLMYLFGLVAAIAVQLAIINFLSVSGNGKLLLRLAAKLEREGVDPKTSGGIYVGLSPDAVPRVYESDYSWDMGFLFFASERLCYLGEGIRFLVPREQVIATRLGAGPPSWLRYPSLYVSWCDTRRGKVNKFNVRPEGVGSLRQMRREGNALGLRARD